MNAQTHVSPLARALEGAGVQLLDAHGSAAPRAFATDLSGVEVAAARGSVALAALPWRSHVLMRGSHRQRWFHNMTTCDVKGRAPGQGNFGLVVEGKGKTVADFLLDVHEDHFVVELARQRIEPALAQLRRFLIADDVRLEPTEGLSVLALVGPRAEATLADVGLPTPAEDFAHAAGELAGVAVSVRRNAVRLGLPGFDLTLAEADAPALWEALEAAGATPIGFEAWEILRVEQGIPEVGVDFGEDNVPLESAALAATIDWDKGCYIGQEVIAMMHYRGKPNRHLRGLKLGSGDALAIGQELLSDAGKAVGVAGTEVLGTAGEAIALAVVKRRHASAGTVLKTGDGRTATVVELPFVSD